MSGSIFPLFPFDPNWSAIPTETLSWLTDVMESETGAEQRRSLRLFPRKQIEYTGVHSFRDRARLDNLLTGYGAHDWLLPVWWDVHYSENELTPESTSVRCGTAGFGQFREGGRLVLMFGRSEYEIVQIARIESNRIHFANRIGRSWPVGTRILPLHRARFDQEPQLARRSDASVLSTFKFNVTEPDILYNRPIVINGVRGLIYNGLLARRYSRVNDGSIYDREAGITVGHASMMRACAAAHDALRRVTDSGGRTAADRYLVALISLLDGFTGPQEEDGDNTGAILRQPLPTSPDQIVIPHWLYAARGPVGAVADVGDAYELFPSLKRLPSRFASAAPETYRDLHIALTHAARWDYRGIEYRAQWQTLSAALMRSNALGRQQGDGREVFAPWPTLPVLTRENAEPSGLFVNSSHIGASISNELGINSSNNGQNFLSRASSGDVIIEVPTSYEYSQFDVIITTSQKTENNAQPPETETIYQANKVLKTTRYGREFKDIWKGPDAAYKPDQYLYVCVCSDREFNPSQGEAIEIELTINGVVYACDFTPVGTISPEPKPILLPIDFFFSRNDGSTLLPNSIISHFAIAISAIESYRVTFRAMRIVAGNTPSEVSSNLNVALLGEPVAFSPGINPFRISGYPDDNLFIGYTGSPWAAAQTPDIWPFMFGRSGNAFAAYNAENLSSINPATRALIYPFTPRTTTGFTKSPEALLAEQNIEFIRQAQLKYRSDSPSNELGPFAYTFLQNRPERFKLVDFIQAHTWLYNNKTTENDTIWQCRLVESLANFARLSYYSGQHVIHMGGQVTYNGTPIYYSSQNEDALLSFDQSRGWLDAVAKSKIIVLDFIRWYEGKLFFLSNVSYETQLIKYTAQQVVYPVTSNEISLISLPVRIDDPTVGPAPYGDYPQGAAVMLRVYLWVIRWNDANASAARTGAVRAWRYMERFWTETGPIARTWFDNDGEMCWWYSEFILTCSELLRNPNSVPSEIDLTIVQDRLVKTMEWLDNNGIQRGELIPGLDLTYEGISVLSKSPNEVNNMTVSLQRLTEDFDDDISIPLRAEYDPGVWNRPQYTWWIKGKKDHDSFKKMLYALRGRAVPFWLPTHSVDFVLAQDIAPGSYTIDVENVSYTISGGPRRTRQHIAVHLYDGSFEFREIVSSQEINDNVERLFLNRPFRTVVKPSDVHRISFMDLVRFDQDGIQIGHISDTDGVSTSTTVFKSVKNY